MKKFIPLIIGVFMFTHSANALDGPKHGLNKKLVMKLHYIEKVFGKEAHITLHGGCRLHGNRMAPKSYHRIAVGCKAADIYMKGVSPWRLYTWCLRHNNGGCGYYCGRSFIHIDVGPKRHWKWFCGKRRTRYAKIKRKSHKS